MTIEDIKLIRHNIAGIDDPDDPSYPFKLEASFRPPEFMEVAHLLLHGNEVIVVRGKTREALELFAGVNHLDKHPRLISMTITEPDKDKV
jgi:hypothetical protein